MECETLALKTTMSSRLERYTNGKAVPNSTEDEGESTIRVYLLVQSHCILLCTCLEEPEKRARAIRHRRKIADNIKVPITHF
ncbi:uncharacterized protein J3R85_016518 [Psidium guajava]|nr:uncharacterized protein J3R85_016518 [Psidium guajava]